MHPTFHVLSSMSFLLAVLCLVLVTSHPIILLSILMGCCLGLVELARSHKILSVLLFTAFLTLVLLPINSLLSQNGETILFSLPALPFVESRFISLESLLFSLHMGVKLAIMLLLFVFGDALISKDRFFSFLTKFFPKGALLLTLVIESLPNLRRAHIEASDAMSMRALRPSTPSRISGLKRTGVVLRSLFASTLESSWSKTEALHSRAFGLTKPTCYSKQFWKLRDSMLVILTFLIAIMIWQIQISQIGTVVFYPEYVVQVSSDLILISTFLVLSLLIIARLSSSRL